MSVMGEPQVRAFSTAGRITISVLLLVLPVSCLLLGLTAPDAGAWYVIAAVNLVIPAVILPVVWRRPEAAHAPASQLDDATLTR